MSICLERVCPTLVNILKNAYTIPLLFCLSIVIFLPIWQLREARNVISHPWVQLSKVVSQADEYKKKMIITDLQHKAFVKAAEYIFTLYDII